MVRFSRRAPRKESMQKVDKVDKKGGALCNESNQYGKVQSDRSKSLLCVEEFACGREIIGRLLSKVVIFTLPVLTAFMWFGRIEFAQLGFSVSVECGPYLEWMYFMTRESSTSVTYKK